MMKRIQTYIVQEPWDEALLRKERYLNRAIWIGIALAALYFSPFILYIITKG